VNFVIWVCVEHLYQRRCDLTVIFGCLGMLGGGLVPEEVGLTSFLGLEKGSYFCLTQRFGRIKSYIW
jgi:hypothetical protein